MRTIRNERQLRWMIAAAWTILIYATLSLVRPVCEYLKSVVPLDQLMMGVMGGFLLVFVVYMLATRQNRRKRQYAALLVAVSAYAYGMSILPYPEEQVHFLEYGLLAFLIFRALRLDVSAARAYAGAVVVTAVLGFVDEWIQGILPNRYYGTGDVILNAVSGVLGLLTSYALFGAGRNDVLETEDDENS